MTAPYILNLSFTGVDNRPKKDREVDYEGKRYDFSIGCLVVQSSGKIFYKRISYDYITNKWFYYESHPACEGYLEVENVVGWVPFPEFATEKDYSPLFGASSNVS